MPGYEAPVNLAYSSQNRSAAIRIPMYSDSPKAKRLEFRCPDPSCNGYLTFTAVMMALLDGIRNKIKPGKPMDASTHALSPEQRKEIASTPSTLEEALVALEHDNAFLLEGNVFSEELISSWVNWKREKEIAELRLRPHPHEFHLYYDA